jgi:hypothetical protein
MVWEIKDKEQTIKKCFAVFPKGMSISRRLKGGSVHLKLSGICYLIYSGKEN